MPFVIFTTHYFNLTSSINIFIKCTSKFYVNIYYSYIDININTKIIQNYNNSHNCGFGGKDLDIPVRSYAKGHIVGSS